MSRSPGQPGCPTQDIRELGPSGSVTDGGSDPGIDVSEHAGGRLLARYGVKAIASLNIVGLEPSVFEASQHARVRRMVSQQDAQFVAL
jgi:hypothetical protein